jgi:hypothetical protein
MNANTHTIQNMELVSLKVKQSQTRFTFPVLENLRGKKIVSIEVFPNSVLPYGTLGETNCNANAFKQGFLTLQISGREKIKSMPLQSLVSGNNNGLMKTFDKIIINEQKSYVEFSATTNLVDEEVVLIAFYYED